MERDSDILLKVANGIAGSLFALTFLMTAAKHILVRSGLTSKALKWSTYALILLAVLHGCQSYIHDGSLP